MCVLRKLLRTYDNRKRVTTMRTEKKAPYEYLKVKGEYLVLDTEKIKKGFEGTTGPYAYLSEDEECPSSIYFFVPMDTLQRLTAALRRNCYADDLSFDSKQYNERLDNFDFFTYFSHIVAGNSVRYLEVFDDMERLESQRLSSHPPGMSRIFGIELKEFSAKEVDLKKRILSMAKIEDEKSDLPNIIYHFNTEDPKVLDAVIDLLVQHDYEELSRYISHCELAMRSKDNAMDDTTTCKKIKIEREATQGKISNSSSLQTQVSKDGALDTHEFTDRGMWTKVLKYGDSINWYYVAAGMLAIVSAVVAWKKRAAISDSVAGFTQRPRSSLFSARRTLHHPVREEKDHSPRIAAPDFKAPF